LTTWTQTLLDPAGVSVGQVGIILTSCVLAGVVGTVVIPVLAARRRKEIRTAVVGIVVIAAGCVVLALVPGFGTGLVSLSLTGLLLLPLLAIILELVERSSGDADGVTAGLVWTMGTLGGLVVTGVVGFTLDRPTVSFLILTAVALLGLPLLARLRHPVANMASGDVQAESADPAEPCSQPGAPEGSCRRRSPGCRSVRATPRSVTRLLPPRPGHWTLRSLRDVDPPA
jgi:sugar phosphate permease